MIRSLALALAYCGMIFGILLVAFGIIRFFHGVIDGEISLPGFKEAGKSWKRHIRMKNSLPS